MCHERVRRGRAEIAKAQLYCVHTDGGERLRRSSNPQLEKHAWGVLGGAAGRWRGHWGLAVRGGVSTRARLGGPGAGSGPLGLFGIDVVRCLQPMRRWKGTRFSSSAKSGKKGGVLSVFAILANAKSERCGFEGLGAYGWGVRGVAHRDEREAQMWAPYGFRGPHVRGGPRSGKLLFASLRADVSARLPEAVSGEGGFTCERFAPSGSPGAVRPERFAPSPRRASFATRRVSAAWGVSPPSLTTSQK